MPSTMLRRSTWLLATAVQFLAVASALESPGKPSRLWQNSAGSQWNDCFLIGNGRLGASIPGGVQNDSIWLNEDTFWNGRYKPRINPKAAAAIPVMRQHVLEGKYGTVQDMATSDYDGVPQGARNYNTLGSMDLVMAHGPADKDSYERWLDLGEASAGVSYSVGGVNYTREYIASHPADLMVYRISASKPGAVSFSVSLRRPPSASAPSGADTVVMTGDCGGDLPIDYAVGARIVATGGNVAASGTTVSCTGADEALVFVTAWTSVRQADSRSKVLADLKGANGSFKAFRDAHAKDYKALYDRSDFGFGASTPAQRAMTTAERVGAMSKDYDPEFALMFLQFARYLLIASSRRGSLPSNLQGIWNSELKPMWGSRFTININLRALLRGPFLDKADGSRDELLACLRHK
jgi:alpha-L-fucosidase 2